MRLLLLTLILTASAACVRVPNIRNCSTLGLFADGMSCVESQTTFSYDLTIEQAIDFIEPQPERDCVPVPGTSICSGLAPTAERPSVHLAARAGAVCRSNDDETKMKNALEQACRQLGNRCTKEIQEALK